MCVCVAAEYPFEVVTAVVSDCRKRLADLEQRRVRLNEATSAARNVAADLCDRNAPLKPVDIAKLLLARSSLATLDNASEYPTIFRPFCLHLSKNTVSTLVELLQQQTRGLKALRRRRAPSRLADTKHIVDSLDSLFFQWQCPRGRRDGQGRSVHVPDQDDVLSAAAAPVGHQLGLEARLSGRRHHGGGDASPVRTLSRCRCCVAWVV